MGDLSIDEAAPEGYKEVRGLTRGLHVLRALNALPGGMGSIGEIASECGLHRTTVKRLLETLRAEGIVRPGERQGQYGLTFEVLRLTEGYVDEAWVSKVAKPCLRASVKTLLWPCDVATVDAGFMVIRESTHRWSSLSQHRAVIGRRLPILTTSLGRAYISHCSSDERAGILTLLSQRDDTIGQQARDRNFVDRVLQETTERGYAITNGMPGSSFSSFAVPVLAGRNVLASLNMVFPRNAVSPEAIRQRYWPALTALALRIGNLSQSWMD